MTLEEIKSWAGRPGNEVFTADSEEILWLLAEVERLDGRITRLKRYCRHDSDCRYRDGACTCGLYEILELEVNS